MYLGFAGYTSILLYQHRSRAEQVASLLLDARWPWVPSLVAFGVGQRWSKRTKKKRLAGAKGVIALRDALLDNEHHEAELDYQAAADGNHAHLQLQTGTLIVDPIWANPITFTGHTKADELPAEADLSRCIEVIHQLMTALEVAHAVLTVLPTEAMVVSDTTFIRTLLDTPQATYNLGVRGAFELQRKRANYWRAELGDKYIRHPRWGTYLRRAHLDRVGGLERIRGEVPLAKILELGGAGDLVYLQCTEHPAGALTPEGEQIRQKLEEVLEPIVAPPRPQEQLPAG